MYESVFDVQFFFFVFLQSLNLCVIFLGPNALIKRFLDDLLSLHLWGSGPITGPSA